MFIGVDQSLNGTGICVLDAEGKPAHLATIDPGVLRDGARLSLIKKHLESVLQKYHPVGACREGYSYGSVGKVFELGEVGGIVELVFFEANIGLAVVAPSALKKFATGRSTADKEMMKNAAEFIIGAPVEDDNCADAFFLASVAYHINNDAAPKTRYQLEVLKQLLSPAPKPSKRRVRTIVKNAL